MRKVNLREKLASIRDHWHPRIVGELNGQHIKVAKVHGEFVWHRHDNEDELFLVLKGKLKICLRNDDDLVLTEGEFAIVPKGVEHKPVAADEAQILLLEPAGTLNTGDTRGDLTVDEPEWI